MASKAGAPADCFFTPCDDSRVWARKEKPVAALNPTSFRAPGRRGATNGRSWRTSDFFFNCKMAARCQEGADSDPVADHAGL
jgi:hypothetical protein